MNPTNVSVLTETIVSHSVLSNTVFLMGVDFMGNPIEFGQNFLMCLFSEFAFNTGGYFSRSKGPLNSYISLVYSIMVGSLVILFLCSNVWLKTFTGVRFDERCFLMGS